MFTSTIVDAFSKVFPILLILGLGFFLRRRQFLQPGTVQELKKLVINVTLPALLFLAFSRVDLQPQYALIVGLVFLACLLALMLGERLKPIAGDQARYFPALMTGFEAGMMGYAIYTSVYGQENLYKFGIIDLGQVTFVFFVLVTALERITTGSRPLLQTAKKFLTTPVILAILAGILFKASGLAAAFAAWPISNSLLVTLSLIGGLTTPLVALVIGYDVNIQPGSLRMPLVSIALRLLFWVPAGLLLNWLVVGGLLRLDAGFQAAVMTMFVLPPPFVIPLFMQGAASEERNFVVNSLSLATLVTLFAFTVITVLYAPAALQP